MLPVREFFFIALFYTGVYSAPQNHQHFKEIKVGGNFYNHVSSPQNDQNFEGRAGDEFFNVRGETGLNPPLRNSQTFRNVHVGGKFYNNVPKTGNDQDLTGLITEGGFYDANSNGSTLNGQNLRNKKVNGQRDIQTFGNAHIGGVPNTGNTQHSTDLNAESGFVDASGNGPTQSRQNLRNVNLNDPRNIQTSRNSHIEGWAGDEFFNVRGETGLNPPLRNSQTFRNAHVGGKFYNNVPKTGNDQDLTGLIAEGGFYDANSNGPTLNGPNLRNGKVNGQRDIQTYGNAHIGGVPNTGNTQHFTDLNAEGGFVDASGNGPTQSRQNLRNVNSNDPRNIQTSRNVHIGGKVYNNVPKTGNNQDLTGLNRPNAEGVLVNVNNQNRGPTQNGRTPRNQYDAFVNRQHNRNFGDVTVDGDLYNDVRGGAVRDYPYVTHRNVRSIKTLTR